MVRITTVLSRIPVIKFRKGGLGHSAGPSIPASTPSSGIAPAANTAALQSQHTATMSTISDVDLPPRYRRAPLSQEEIDHINGGGINNPQSSSQIQETVFAVNLPNKFLIQCRKKQGSHIKSVNTKLGKNH